MALGMITTNEEEYLKKHLPIISKSFDGLFAVDGYSTDKTVEVLKQFGFKVSSRIWDNNYSNARNAVIDMAEKEKYNSLFMLDADECMFPEDIKSIKKLIEEQAEAIRLPRYEFGPTSEFYNPSLYPDYQGRVFRLGLGYHYRNVVHEALHKGSNKLSINENNGFSTSDTTPIYHYGRCKNANEIALRSLNYDRLSKNLPLLKEIPEGVIVNKDTMYGFVKSFQGKQPV